MSYIEEESEDAKIHNKLTTNQHVILRKKYLFWLSKQSGGCMAQLVYYTELMKEINPKWKPYD